MAKKIKEIIIPKEKAVFWLDRHGRWNNEHGMFAHKKIIDFFHASIKRDKDGYHLSQSDGSCREKVYFPYEDTALFVFDVIREKDLILVLNTKKRTRLKPRRLYMHDDNLYMRAGEEKIKFTSESLMKLSDLIESSGDQYFIRVKDRRYRIGAHSS